MNIKRSNYITVILLIINLLWIISFPFCSPQSVVQNEVEEIEDVPNFQSRVVYGDASVMDEALKLDPLYLDHGPTLIHRSSPEYPEYCIKNDIEGRVLVTIVVDEIGNVIYAETKESIWGLNESAVEAAIQLKFEPLKVKNNPKKFTLDIPFVFSLE